jgi:DNA-binding GntR family transcriptional regulator
MGSHVNKKSSADPRHQTIYTEIRDRISLLEYPPGMALSENALAAEFGVSRTPIRHVLQRLEFEGLVESKRGIGNIVTTVELKRLKEVYSLRIRLHELHGDLSPVIRASDDDIAALEELRSRAEGMRGRYDPTELARLYNAFQDQMLGFTSNEPLREISEMLYYQTARVWLQMLPELVWDEEVGYVVDEIAQVIEALRSSDARRLGEIRRDYLALNLRQMFGQVE